MIPCSTFSQGARSGGLPLLLFALVLLLVIGCDSAVESPSDERVGRREAAIVGGVLEDGWAGVGALTLVFPRYGYYGSFCTGTLIDPYWVLTAAHCLDEHLDMPIYPDIVRFYVGTDARPQQRGGFPASGRLFQAAEFFVHPDYDRETTANDIGLIRLEKPAEGVPVYPLQTDPMGSQMVGDDSFHVGFGVTDGVRQSGSGIKRSTHIRISQYIQDSYYVTEYDGSGVCFGDSGGPGFYFSGGTWRVAGVNSTVAASGVDPCREYYVHMRVDYFQDWIASLVADVHADCKADPGICACPEACRSDGSCDNMLCRTMDCAELYDCLVACGENSACLEGCLAGATPEAQALFESLLGCLDTHCANVSDDAFQRCAWDFCEDEINACYPPAYGDESCGYVYSCMVDCGRDGACQLACFEGGTKAAQDNVVAMFDCWERHCAAEEDDDVWLSCVYQSCGSEIDDCFEPVNCSLLGGDCLPGTACYWTNTGATDCYRSTMKELGVSCDPYLEMELACGDGLYCAGEEGRETCRRFCTRDSDCDGSEICIIPYFDDRSDYGLCSLTEGDTPCFGDECGEPSPDPEPDPDPNPAPDPAPQPDQPHEDNGSARSSSGLGCSSAPGATGGGVPLMLLVLAFLWLKRSLPRAAGRLGPVALLLGCCVVVHGCHGEPPSPLGNDFSEKQSPIVGGEREFGWLGVGALTRIAPGWGYQGSFCTGTLIAPRWVLTAAHCLIDEDGQQIPPRYVQFYVGADATSQVWGEPPPTGELYPAEAFYPHPEYDSVNTSNDIGLIRLAVPASGVDYYPINMDPIRSLLGEEVFYVGFGVTSGTRQTGSGIKRSAEISLFGVDETYYVSIYGGTGVCFGDSGGPGLYRMDGDWRIIGVNSAGSGSGNDPCRGFYIHTRVDHFATWITGKIAADLDCRAHDHICLCPQACGSEGICENERCRLLDCGGLKDCLDGCGANDSICRQDCYNFTSEAGQASFDALGRCSAVACMNLRGEARDNCIAERCGSQLDECVVNTTGDEESCEALLMCGRACPGSDPYCREDCLAQGTDVAQGALMSLYLCWLQECGPLENSAAYRQCTNANCTAEFDECVPAIDCDIVGGDCPEGAACYTGPNGANDCFQSDELSAYEPCSPAWTNALPCADGMSCVRVAEDEAVCVPRCRTDADCHGMATCTVPWFSPDDDYGLCPVAPGLPDGPDDPDDPCLDDEHCDPHDPGGDDPEAPPCLDGDDSCQSGERDLNELISSGGCSSAPGSGAGPVVPLLLLALFVVLRKSVARHVATS